MASDSLAGHWLLVETMGDDPTVIAEGDRPRDMRRVSSMFRGPVKDAVSRVIEAAISAREPVTRPVSPEAADALGGDFGLAAPTVGPTGSVVAVQCWFGSAADNPGPPDPIGVWEWELGLEDRPPRLHLTGTALDLLGIDPKFRDRSTYGPADYFTRIERVSDLIDLDTKIKTASPGDQSHGTVIVCPDGGPLRSLQYAQRYVTTPVGPRLQGVCRDITQFDDPAKQRIELIEHTLLQVLLEEVGVYAVIGDITWPTAPYVMRWLTPHPPGTGHGVSTGQTPGIHPDDIPQVIGWIYQIIATGQPVRGRARTRAAGGGWIAGNFLGQLLDPVVSKTIGVGIVYPDSITIEGAEDTSRG